MKKKVYYIFLYILYGVLFIMSLSLISLMFLRGESSQTLYNFYDKFKSLIIFFWILGGSLSILWYIVDELDLKQIGNIYEQNKKKKKKS